MEIPILRPLLPQRDALLPYLQRIDERRYYSNYGPLVLELEQRLAARLGVPIESLTTVVNATAGLTAVLQAMGTPHGSLCAMPAWTFIASAQAARMAGLKPWFLDVELDSWALSPAIVDAALRTLPPGERLGAVMPVMPFGQPIDLAAWEAFRARTGIPVVIDAAAGFDSLSSTELPCVVSLHATKVLGCGEGGFVVAHDTTLLRRVRNWTVFGFEGRREAVMAGNNAKMSEYSAAVGLAALDEWNQARAAFMGRADRYRQAFSGQNVVRLQPGFGQDWVAATCVIRLPEGRAAPVQAGLRAVEAESHNWWGRGAHDHPSTRQCLASALPVTNLLASATLGLPFARDIGNDSIGVVAKAVLAAAV